MARKAHRQRIARPKPHAPSAKQPLHEAQPETDGPFAPRSGGNQPARRQSGSGSLSPGMVLRHQQTVGNQAVQRMLAARVQPKLTVTAPADQHEQEADRVASQAARDRATPDGQAAPGAAISPLAQRAGGDGAFEAGDTIERQLASRAGQGSPLPDQTRAEMEGHIGADFSAVRVHTDSEAGRLNQSLQARAFTHGSDIYFSSGAYAPDASDGKHLLAHELTHVVQQGGAGQASVQRLMTQATFKAETPGKWRSRSKVDEIDTLLKQYEKLGDANRTNAATHDAKLAAIEQKCAAYAGNRTVGVQKLLASVQRERSFIKPLGEAATLLNAPLTLKDALRKIFQSQDKFLEAMRSGHTIQGMGPDYDRLIGDAQRALNDAGTRDQVMHDLVMEDVQQLIAMSTSPHVDPLLKQVLVEVLANVNQIHFQETQGMASGAVLAGAKDRGKGITEKYRLDMQMNQKQGGGERMSSLVHEMTHISTQEKFGNTAIHLAFKKTASDTDVVDLSNKRTGQCNELNALLPQLNGVLTPQQIDVIKEKVTYPISGKNTLKSYADTFKKKGELSDPDYNRIIGLVNAGANNTLIEFDTVINQMLFLMQVWNVPATNAFFAKLKAVATEAYAWRHA